MRKNYTGGNYGYGHAKQALFELIIEKFSSERASFNHYINNPEAIDAKLKEGEEKARKIARVVLGRVREKLGY
jgi:tryptophanyl-tRNA synthetase